MSALFTAAWFCGCNSDAGEREAVEQLRALNALVVLDINKHASSIALPDDTESIHKAMPLLPNLTHLTSFGAINTPITDEAMKTVGRLRSLTNVDVSGTKITDAGVNHLVGLSKLSSLNIAGTKVTSACLADVGRLRGIDMLNLANTDLSGGFEHLAGCKSLSWLVLSHMTLSDDDAAALARHPSLKRLSASTAVSISENATSTLRDSGIQVDLPSTSTSESPAVNVEP